MPYDRAIKNLIHRKRESIGEFVDKFLKSLKNNEIYSFNDLEEFKKFVSLISYSLYLIGKLENNFEWTFVDSEDKPSNDRFILIKYSDYVKNDYILPGYYDVENGQFKSDYVERFQKECDFPLIPVSWREMVIW